MSQIRGNPYLGNSGYTPQHPRAIRRDHSVFRLFEEQVVTPAKTPTAKRFYYDNFKENLGTSYEQGYKRYARSLRQEPLKALSTALLATTLGVAFTVFPKHKNWVKALFLLGFVGYPVKASLKHMPEMVDAYRMAREGNPTQAEQKFKKSLNELSFAMFQNYVKPLSIAAFIVWPLLNPKAAVEHYSKRAQWVADKLALKSLVQ